jgi:hypothetical protein
MAKCVILRAGILRLADDGAVGRGEAMSDHSEDDTPSGGRTWLTALLARASRGVDNDEQDLTPRWTQTQTGETNRQRR